ncbi:MAG: hypothetical protein NVS3B9_6300 [Candidatus Doudnabacteria bacterium]
MKSFKSFMFLALILLGSYGIFRVYKHFNRPVAKIKFEQIKWREVEGWTNQEIITDLDQRNIVSQKDLNSQLKIAAKNYTYFGENVKIKSLEGYLFPDTYFFAKNATAEEVLNKILQNTATKITPGMIDDIHAQKKSVYDVLTLASIVEREVGRNTSTVTSADLATLQSERETVAGIFVNRLIMDMPLQSDATIGYITKSKSPSATSSELQIDSPYNTYMYKGLPPGPIGNPSLSAIEATIHFKKSNYLYFLSKPDGTAVYAKTLAEQNANKANYLK